eukprot:m.35125 g.35125  ORF g.35125 m.35125 type:complete len:622 (+) comp32065_c0_seq1:113-1978(+)
MCRCSVETVLPKPIQSRDSSKPPQLTDFQSSEQKATQTSISFLRTSSIFAGIDFGMDLHFLFLTLLPICSSTSLAPTATPMLPSGDGPSCPDGFAWNGTDCSDVDECAGEENGGCMHDCENTDGGFVCFCRQGYELEDNERDCRDVNECEDSEIAGGGCPANSACVNTPGSFLCDCLKGFVLNGTQCVDVDECIEEKRGGCSPHASCQNQPGSFTCLCANGYTGDGKNCTGFFDRIVLRASTNPYLPLAIGLQWFTPYDDIVRYQIEYRGETDDEWMRELVEGRTFFEVAGLDQNKKYFCRVRAEFSGGAQSRWSDVAETVTGDVDECRQQDACLADRACVNTVGSFVCMCPNGFTGYRNGPCEDVDECSNGTHSCHAHAFCVNLVGDYHCACLVGFTGDGEDCQDVDECEADSLLCSSSADCTNTLGSYQCDCMSGYAGNGSACDDIDECLEDGACDTNAHCNNLPGSFTCECNPGYELLGVVCIDVDECEELNTCHRSADCFNLEGSYECQCIAGYEGNGFECEDTDECARDLDECGENSTCVNELGSYRCDCHAGYESDETGRRCNDIDECLDGSHTCDNETSQCLNHEGSFSCHCLSGFTMINETSANGNNTICEGN